MRIEIEIKKDVNIIEAFKMFQQIREDDERIENDVHTDKHYVLRNGKMWLKGDGTGKWWDWLCRSREAHYHARKMLGY